MAPVVIDSGAKNAYYSAGNIGWSARSAVANHGVINQLAGTSNNTFGNNAVLAAQAQSFTPASAVSLSAVRIVLAKVASPVDNLSLEIRSDTGANLPSSTVLGTATTVINGANLTTSPNWVEFNFSTPVALSASTKYWLVVQRSGAIDATNYYRVYANLSSAYAGGGTSTYDSGTTTWGAESASTDWIMQILQERPVALYHVTQDTSLHVWKSTDDGASWAEQDAADAPTVTNANYPFDAPATRTGPYIITARMTATNTAAVRVFNMSTDQWDAADYGVTPPTTVSNERNIRVANDNGFVTASPGNIILCFSDSTDDADPAYQRAATVAATWSAKAILSAVTSTEASLFSDVVMDRTSPGFLHRFYYECNLDDYVNRSVAGATQGTATALSTAAADVETEHASATYQPYVDSGVTKIIAAFIDAAGTIQERILSLDVTSASVTMATDNAVSAATTAAGRQLSTARYGTTNYIVAASGSTAIDYYTSTVAGTWSAATNWKTGLFTAALSQILSIPGYGVGVFYTTSSAATFDWLVAPSSGTNAIGTVTAGTIAATGESITGTFTRSETGTITVGTIAATGQSITATAGTGASGSVTVGTVAATGQSITATATQSASATITQGTVAATGQSVTGTAGTGATGAVTAGTIAATGQSITGTFSVSASATITQGTVAATGETVTATAGTGASGSVTPGTVAATGQSVTASFTVSDSAAITVGTVAATGQSVSAAFTVSETATITPGTAVATGENVTGTFGVAAVGTVTPGTAAATGQTVNAAFGHAATITAGTIAATGEDVEASASVTGTIEAEAILAYGEDVTANYGATGVVTVGAIAATGEVITSIAGGSAVGVVTAGTVAATGEDVTGTATTSASATITAGTIAATGEDVTAVGGVSASATITVGTIAATGENLTAGGGTSASATITEGTIAATGETVTAGFGISASATITPTLHAATGQNVEASASVSASITPGTIEATGLNVSGMAAGSVVGIINVGTTEATGTMVVATTTSSASATITPGAIEATGYLITAGTGVSVVIEPATIAATGLVVTATTADLMGELVGTVVVETHLRGTVIVEPYLRGTVEVAPALVGTVIVENTLTGVAEAVPHLEGVIEV